MTLGKAHYVKSFIWQICGRDKGGEKLRCKLNELHHKCISDALCDLVPFLQFKKREKRPRRSITFRKVAGFAQSLIIDLIHNLVSRAFPSYQFQ